MKYLALAAVAATLLTGCVENYGGVDPRPLSERFPNPGDSYDSGQRGTRYDPATKGNGGVRTARPQTPN